MTENDLDRIVEIENEAFDEPWSRKCYSDELANKGYCYYYVAEIENETAGYIGAWYYLQELHITTLAVSAKFKGKNIGKLLVWYLLELMRINGANFAMLEVRISNSLAINLYKGFGFDHISTRKRYYSDKEDAFVMFLDLNLETTIKKLSQINEKLEKSYNMSEGKKNAP